MLACYFLGPLFTDWAPGCYVRCGCIGFLLFSFPVDGVGVGVPVHLFFVVVLEITKLVGYVNSKEDLIEIVRTHQHINSVILERNRRLKTA